MKHKNFCQNIVWIKIVSSIKISARVTMCIVLNAQLFQQNAHFLSILCSGENSLALDAEALFKYVSNGFYSHSQASLESTAGHLQFHVELLFPLLVQM